MSMRTVLGLGLGRAASRLPHFRGKNRLALAWLNLLQLPRRHTTADAKLRKPVAYRAKLDLHSWLQRLAFVSGAYEPTTSEFLSELFLAQRRNGYLLDIGANIGLISMPVALMLRNQKGRLAGLPIVISVEAVPANVEALKYNVTSNQLDADIGILGCGLGDVEGVFSIQVEGDLLDGEGTGTANILPVGSVLDPNNRYECTKFDVQVSTLDKLFTEGTLPAGCAVVKIDTDGYDLKILAGGTSFIAECRPIIFGEFAKDCLKWHQQSVADVQAFCEAKNYRVWQKLPGADFKFQQEVTPNYSQDLLLVPNEMASVVQWCLRLDGGATS